ncbi:conserved hypothetical protein [Candidatus Koribacter versatilis Ellin345]|uniref:40-residue YVTN beta-propeller repeat protein n=1 Tax=Koribacter versatilis (strain Ellin345) TaxID=204669 RepID=Q1ISI2_KORVE|nr:YncE family protein [Candidatus Koribacter versatilis]ABF40168.1 conserved hypothetical protein [Candidatus Koribacter versatilis Ellin345]
MRIAVVSLALGIVFSGFGFAQNLLVLEKSDRTLAIVDPATQKVLARTPAGEDPHEIVASADGHFAYITNYGAFDKPHHTLTIVDVTQRKTIGTLDLGSLLAPHGLSLSEGKVYFTAEGSKAIGRYNPDTKQVDWTLGIGNNRTHMIVVHGDRIFTSNVNSDSISIIERDAKADVSGWTQTVVPVGKGPEGFDVSPDGTQLWAANSGDGTVSIVDVTSKKVAANFDIHVKRSNRLKFTVDGKLVLVSDLGSGDVVVLDAATHKEVKRLNVGKGAAGILIPPDGARAYVASSGDGNIAIVDLKSLSITGHIPVGKGPDGMAWATPAR